MTDTSVPRLEVAGPTPGPWRSEDDRVTTRDGRVICDVRHAGTYITGYNALLIAAAPDLLAACEAIDWVVKDCELPGPVPLSFNECAMLRNAIRKAKGGHS